ncbi:UNVERIFIED_CONTAM: Mobile element protein [Euhalothece sp. KZN 001]
MNNTKDTAKPKLFIGMDIHKRSWRIQTATDLVQGKAITLPSVPEALQAYLNKNYPDYEVYTAYEAGCCGYSAHRAFLSYGWHSIVVNPADISRTGNLQYQKNDKLDAKNICRELKDGRLNAIGVPDKEREHLRCLFRRRCDLSKEVRRLKSQIKSQLLYLGVKLPEKYDNPHWSKEFLAWLRDLYFENPTAEAALESRLNQYDFVEKELRCISNDLRAWCREHYKTDYNLLRSVPGIGPIVACGIISELGDLRRFKNFKQLAAYVGLIPGMSQSGDGKVHSRGINPRGNRIIRSYMVESTWQAIRFDPVMERYYRKHNGKDSKARLVKTARKLLSRTYAVVKTGIPYQAGVVE